MGTPGVGDELPLSLLCRDSNKTLDYLPSYSSKDNTSWVMKSQEPLSVFICLKMLCVSTLRILVPQVQDSYLPYNIIQQSTSKFSAWWKGIIRSLLVLATFDKEEKEQSASWPQAHCTVPGNVGRLVILLSVQVFPSVNYQFSKANPMAP
jgi:hypothetical protein